MKSVFKTNNNPILEICTKHTSHMAEFKCMLFTDLCSLITLQHFSLFFPDLPLCSYLYLQ